MMDEFLTFQNIEQGFRRKLSADNPVVVRFDGKNVTKNHKKFHLMDTNGFTKTIFDAAIHISVGAECYIYAALDEVNIVYYNPIEFFGKTNDCDLLYSAVMILQDFLRWTRQIYPQVKFNVSVFNITVDQIEDYIKYRKQLAYTTAATYYAKENLSPALYHGKSAKTIIKNLEKNGFDISSPNIKQFLTGFQMHTHPDRLNLESWQL